MTVPAKRGRRPVWMTPFGHESLGDVFMDRMWPEWQRDYGEEWKPAVNFFEKEGKYYLTAELPGISKEEINIAFDKGVLTITGKKENHREEEKADYYLKETSYGVFSRSFKLPGEIEEEKVTASFKDGVLTVEMPHKEESTTKKIAIN